MLDLNRFRADGYLLVPGLVDDGTAVALKDELQRFAATNTGLSVELQLVHRSRLIRDFGARGRIFLDGGRGSRLTTARGPNAVARHLTEPGESAILFDCSRAGR